MVHFRNVVVVRESIHSDLWPEIVSTEVELRGHIQVLKTEHNAQWNGSVKSDAMMAETTFD